MTINDEDEIPRTRAPQATEGLTALVMKLPDHKPERNFVGFSKMQYKALYDLARKLVAEQKLEELSWEDAWSGILPERPPTEEIDQCFDLVIKDATRLLTEGWNDSDSASFEADARMTFIDWACRQEE